MEPVIFKMFSFFDRKNYRAMQKITKNEEVLYWVQDLSECPEDAVIGRDLFNIHDYKSAVMLGYELGKRGLEVQWEEVESTEEDFN